MIHRLKIRQKLLVAFLIMGLAPMLVAMFISHTNTAATLEHISYQHLTSIREIKKRLIEDYFAERFNDLAMLAATTSHLQINNGRLIADEVSQGAHAYYTQFKEKGQYYDLFLINKEGFVFYTIEHESDYQTSLSDGPYAGSNLGKLFRKVSRSQRAEIADFAPYAPSANAPAAFIAQPVFDADGNVVLVVALQLSIDHLNQVMTARAGQGKTGETYLVGPDNLMRSDSYLDPVNHSVIASFANPSSGSVDTEASRAALMGESDTRIIIDYNGNPVLSSYTPLRIKDITWALLSEIDEAEAMAPVIATSRLYSVLVLSALVLVVVGAYLLARSMTRPLKEMTDHISSLAEGGGDLTIKLRVRSNDEIAHLERRFNTFLDKIHHIITRVVLSTRVIEEASGSFNRTVAVTTEGALAQHEDSRAATRSIEQLTASVQSIATSTSEALVASDKAHREIQDGMHVTEETVAAIETLSHDVDRAAEVIGQLDEQSKSISTILEVIQGIAEQTNLLALNAAIEAARAGDAGRGFSVVADEVRNLAARTQSSTKEIQQIIEKLQSQAHLSVKVMTAGKASADKGMSQVKRTGDYFQRITEAMDVLSCMNADIAEASEKQASFANRIYERVMHIDEVADNTESESQGARYHSKQLKELCSQLEILVSQFKIDEHSSSEINSRKRSPAVPLHKK